MQVNMSTLCCGHILEYASIVQVSLVLSTPHSYVMYLHVAAALIVCCHALRPGNEVMYGFSHFTCSLNEHEPRVAPTDCRFRPDQRIMEEGDFPKANEEKVGVASVRAVHVATLFPLV